MKRTLVNLIKETLIVQEDLTHHLEHKEEQLAAHLLETVRNKSELEDRANEATAIYLQHHQADAPFHTIQVSYSPNPHVFITKYQTLSFHSQVDI